MWILPTWCFSIKRPQNPPVFRWKGKRNSRVYNAGRRGGANRLQTAGVPKAGQGRAEKPTTTTFLGSTTRVLSSSLLSPTPPSRTSQVFESYSIRVLPVGGRRARGGGGADGTVACCGCLRDLGERASARAAMGARCSKLSVCWWPPHFKSPMLGAPPTAHCHHRCLSLGFSVFLFSLSSSHSRRAPRPAPDSSVVGGGGGGPAFGVFFLLRLFRGFCCSFPRA